MGEIHLDIFCARLLREYRIEIEVGKPSGNYLETLRNYAEEEGRYIQQVDGCGNYGHVKIRLEPSKTGDRLVDLTSDIKGDEVPSEDIPYMEKAFARLWKAAYSLAMKS